MGGIGLLFMLFSRFGLPGLLIGGALLYFSGSSLFSGGSSNAVNDRQQSAAPGTAQDPEAPMVDFVSFVLDDVQATWATAFAQSGQSYRPAHMVLFRGQTQSGCGTGAASMGPFYCSRDERVYIDLSFYRELKQRFGAPGDFAQAYVIAHEVGHHVQHLLGTDARMRSAPESEQTGANGLSVRFELQADCLAGMWAKATEKRQLLEAGDVEEALGAATAIGDDTLQRKSTGAVAPESWTHGSSEQRVRWFRRGYESTSMDSCDTFGSGAL